jgi:hypothetical protein
MNPEVIKAALDSFENDQFLQSKDLLKGEIQKAKNSFLKSKLDLKNDLDSQFSAMKPEIEIEDENNIEGVVKPKRQSKRMSSKKI